jgi:hypothetical protein
MPASAPIDSTEKLAKRWRALCSALPEALGAQVRDAAVRVLPASVPPWTDSGIHVETGDAFSLIAAGQVERIPGIGLWNGPRSVLWGRVAGKAPLLNGTQDAASFEAPGTGTLELALGLSEWTTPAGDGDPALHAVASGEIVVLVIRWAKGAAAGLETLARVAPDEPLFAAARDHFLHPVPRPPGWSYLWFLGEADIFTSGDHASGPTIAVHCDDDVGILQTPVALDFTPDTRLQWRWRIDSLPSEVAEDSLLTHDYLSVAVEFENGLDLTYYWSAALAPGTHYRCPLPNWDQRETHWVVRSGRGGLGAWHDEARPLYDDYREAVGDPPGRIVRVWLIAVSLFQKGVGAAEFGEIELHSGGRVHRVLEARGRR